MKLTIQTKDLRTALTKLAAIPGSKETLPVAASLIISADSFGGLRLKRITSIASLSVECESAIEEDGDVAVSFDSFDKLAGRTSAAVISLECGEKEQKLRAKAGSSNTTLSRWPEGESATDHPEHEGVKLSFESEKLYKWITIAERAMYNEGGRDHMKGVCIRTSNGNLNIFGCDGRRLHTTMTGDRDEPVMLALGEDGKETQIDAGVLITKEAVHCIRKLIEGDKAVSRFSISRNGFRLDSAGVMKCALGVDTPPNFDIFIKDRKPDITIKLDRLRLLELVRAALPLSYGESKVVGLKIFRNTAELIADNHRDAVLIDSLEVETSKESIHIEFDASYMLDMLASAEEEKVELLYLRDYSAIQIKEPDKLLMLSLIRGGVAMP